MKKEALSRASVFHTAIRQALLQEWDPIGVRELDGAQDEYDAYVPAIYKMLISRKARNEIFDYLWWLETEHMGLTGDRQATGRFADRLMRISDEVSGT